MHNRHHQISAIEFATATVDMVQEHGILGSESWNTGRKHSKNAQDMSENKQFPFRTVTGKRKSQITCGGKTKHELWHESSGDCLGRPTWKSTLGRIEEKKKLKSSKQSEEVHRKSTK